MTKAHETSTVASAQPCVDDAVGVSGGERRWYVAIVRNRSERKVREQLERQGVTCYLPTQDEVRVWADGRRVRQQRVVIPATIFIRCTEPERRRLVTLPYINRFLTNRAGATVNGATRPLATIPDAQIATLRFMLGHSDTPVTITSDYSPGDRVRVIRGDLRGLEGEVIHSPGQSELVVRLDILGCARVAIDPIDVELLK